MRVLAILCLMALSGCGTVAQSPKLVPVACVPADFPHAPVYSDTAEALKAAPSFAARYQELAGNWFSRDARLSVLEKMVDACR